MTKQKKLIIDILKSKRHHLTADEIYMYAKEKMPNIAMGTIYRNLNILADNNEIKRVSLPNMADKFEWNIDKHDHLICITCGEVSDFKISEIEKVLKHNIKNMTSYNMSVNYMCDKCNDKASK